MPGAVATGRTTACAIATQAGFPSGLSFFSCSVRPIRAAHPAPR